MKETLESLAVIVAMVVAAEVINEVVGYRMIDVKVDKNTIRRGK